MHYAPRQLSLKSTYLYQQVDSAQQGLSYDWPFSKNQAFGRAGISLRMKIYSFSAQQILGVRGGGEEGNLPTPPTPPPINFSAKVGCLAIWASEPRGRVEQGRLVCMPPAN